MNDALLSSHLYLLLVMRIGDETKRFLKFLSCFDVFNDLKN